MAKLILVGLIFKLIDVNENDDLVTYVRRIK